MSHKGFLFTLITFLLMFSILLFAKAYLSQSGGLKNSALAGFTPRQMGIIENDVVSNAFNELLSVNLKSIVRGSANIVSFNYAELTHTRSYSSIMSSYKQYIESDYSTLINFNVSLIGVNNSFRIQPYNTIFHVNGQSLYLYFNPPLTNINSITLSAKTDSVRAGGCDQPQNDPGYPVVTVNYYDNNGLVCDYSQSLNPDQDNDKGGGRQFHLDVKDPAGEINTKFGIVDGRAGTFAVFTSGVNANITQLDISYTMDTRKIYLESGDINIRSNVGNVTKTSRIILAQE